MSSDLAGCFAIHGQVDVGSFLDFMTKLDLKFNGVSSRFTYDEEFLGEEPAENATWTEFIADMNSASASLNAGFSGVDYRLSLGFFATGDGRRFAFLGVSGRQIEKLAAVLEERAWTYVDFFVGLRAALNATALAYGMDVDYPSLIAFIQGDLPLAEVDQFITGAIGVPAHCEQVLRSNPSVREINVGTATILSRWLPGLDRYFTMRG